MANQEHVAILKQGVEVWNQFRTENPDIKPNLRRASLRRANLSEANLSEVDFRRANLREADLSETNLIGADLSYANLILADLTGTTLRGVINIDTSKDGSFYKKTYGSGITAGKFHRIGHLSVDSRRSNTESANLSNADLRGANLSGVDLSHIDLSGAYLLDADLTWANLRETSLYEANLRGAKLYEAKLIDTDLSGANLSEMIVEATIFAGIDLCDVKGLDEIEHRGPSYAALDTIQLPEDGRALHFLHGIGISNEWIDFYHAQMMSPIQYYRCFICYSSKDEAFAQRIYTDLQSNNVRCWFAPEHLKIGDKFRHRIDENIRVYEKLLIILSEASLISTRVSYEVERALNKELEGVSNVLVPIRLAKAIWTCETDWAKDIRESRHIGDFEHWKDDDAYQAAFERLLRDLKAQSK